MSDPTSVCNACGDALSENGYCHNKQCSRHGRTNDYLKSEPAVASPAERGPDEDAICARILRIRTEALRDPNADDDLAFTVRELLRILADKDALRARLASLESELREAKADREPLRDLLAGYDASRSVREVRVLQYGEDVIEAVRDYLAARSGSSPERGT